jgi:hypothetical protein
MSDPVDQHPFFEAMREQFIATPLPARRRWRVPRARSVLRPLPLAGVGMSLALAIAALVIALGATGTDPAPAYGVSVNNHTITIYWRQWRQIAQLNARLRFLDMRIRVVPVIRGCVAPVHTVIYARSGIPTHVAPGPAKTIEVAPVRRFGGSGGVLTTWNDTLPGRTRIFTATRAGGWAGGVFTVVGHAPRCVGERR